jgi:ABC-type antimicrobial peptide transport system permease subunit
MDFLRDEVLAINGVKNASYSTNTPLDHNRTHWSNFTFNRSTKDTEFYSVIKRTDHHFLDTYKLTLVAGRGLKPLENTTEFLVNETMLKKLGITNPEEALNKEIDLWEGEIVGLIVGVVKDFQSHSFKDEIAPVLMMPEKNMYGQIGLKLASNEASATLIKVEIIWNRLFPNYVFEYKFLDDKIAAYYEQEKRLSQLYKLSAGIAIFLSCLGLFGLASFMIMQRIKEAGIRKVLGATKNNIVYLLSKEFILLIAIAFCIAAPVAWFFMNNWLEEYAYSIDITWTVFVIGGIGTMLIALSTVGYQAIKVANENPVKSLRTE